MQKYLFVIDAENFKGGYDVKSILDAETGKSIYSFDVKTKNDYIKEGYAVLDENQFNEVNNKCLDSICGEWQEITEEEFQNHLNELPPLYYKNGGFFSPEAFSGDVHSFYQEFFGKYYTSHQRLSYTRKKIIESLYDLCKK